MITAYSVSGNVVHIYIHICVFLYGFFPLINGMYSKRNNGALQHNRLLHSVMEILSIFTNSCLEKRHMILQYSVTVGFRVKVHCRHTAPDTALGKIASMTVNKQRVTEGGM